jgi:large subunit ribosomal protein L1
MKTSFVGENESKNEKKHDEARKGEAEKVHIAGLKGGQRVKIVEAASTEEAPIIEEGVNGDTKKQEKKKIVEKVRVKKFLEAKAKFDREKYYGTKEAVKLIKDSSYSKFEGTMELHIVVKKSGITAQVTLPFQAGRTKKVEIADEDTIKKLKEGKIDFDILVATVEVMPKLVPFARLLGPKGLMPNPKNGTLVADIKKAKSFSTGAITLKTEKEAPLIHTVIGKNSQKDEEIVENAEAVLKALGGAKQIVKAYMKSTMSPSIHLKLN